MMTMTRFSWLADLSEMLAVLDSYLMLAARVAKNSLLASPAAWLRRETQTQVGLLPASRRIQWVVYCKAPFAGPSAITSACRTRASSNERSADWLDRIARRSWTRRAPPRRDAKSSARGAGVDRMLVLSLGRLREPVAAS
jgi:hypothetical protein